MNKFFTFESIQHEATRSEVEKELKGKSFEAKIMRRFAAFVFATNDNFDREIFIHHSVIENSFVPLEGSIVNVEVSIAYDEKKKRWGFSAVSCYIVSHETNFEILDKKLVVRREEGKTMLPNVCRIYIDELWPSSMLFSTRPRHEGVLAGIVWFGDSPDYNVLPWVKTHLRENSEEEMHDSLKQLLNCQRCFPFIMPIFLNDERENAAKHYDMLLQCCFKVLLGWMLRLEGRTIREASFFVERIGGHVAGTDATQKFQGYLAAMKDRTPERFDSWHIREARYEEKEFEYIPYADLLAYIANDQTKRALALNREFSYKKLPGYLPITLDLSQQLDDIDRLEELGNVDQVLNFLIDTRGTALYKLVMKDLKERLAMRQDLQEKLLVALEERYQNKARDLRQLRTLSCDVIRLITVHPNDLPKHIQMIFFALQLQDANHHGDPESAGKVREKYQEVQNDLRIHDREFAAYVDLNVAVSYADSFQFHQAQATVDAIIYDQFFGALTPAMQGRAHSAAGQYHSMLGAYNEAEASFAQALEKFEVADLKEAQKKGECQQTGIYRAINAMDASFPTARELVHTIIPLEAKEIGEIAKDVSHDHEYRHHLLLRALYLVPELHPLRQYYLKEMDDWESALQHPWELINLYRALLIVDSDISDARNLANHYFDQAFMICCDEAHGLILNLLGVMVATVAFCVTGTQFYYGEAQVILNRIGDRLPGAATAMQVLQEVLNAPAPEKVPHVLNCLPFNYH
ncbi:MAG: hypothetical protein GX130_07240 [Candidatus Hydrogenedens sp.]|nr:hypothetical protein [Candidatus Hydrogenedens sp.]